MTPPSKPPSKHPSKHPSQYPPPPVSLSYPPPPSTPLRDRVVRGPYFEDLLAQPEAVRATLEGLTTLSVQVIADQLSGHAFDRVVLTGMGSSLAALHPLALRLIARGHAAIVADTSELLYAMAPVLTERTLLIVASQSGHSVEIVKLVAREKGRVPIVAVTNTPESPLATYANAVVLTKAGSESTVSCKTYVATLAALARLGDLLITTDAASVGGGGIAAEGVVETMTSYLSQWQAHVDELEPLTRGATNVFLAGRGESLAAVYTAGLILKESTRIHAEGMTSAALRHGPMEMAASEKVLALIYDGKDEIARALNQTLASDLRQAGTRAYSVSANADLAVLRVAPDPLLEILPAQMLSLAIAAQQEMEAGRFRHASKITSTE